MGKLRVLKTVNGYGTRLLKHHDDIAEIRANFKATKKLDASHSGSALGMFELV